ncbi:GGDEF domain-containing protein [Novilysobacter defluvii]|nr:GGDEF domain-containing protein [Lysobacter defluvii]
MLKPRLSADFRFGLMVVFGGLAVVAITPFVVYRFATGNHLAAVIDIGIQVAIVSIVAYAWRSGNMDRAGLLAAMCMSGACVAVGLVAGLAGALWLYPVLVANFLLTSRGPAIVISAAAVGTLAFSEGLGGWPTFGSFAVSAMLLCGFAYLFSSHSDEQRRRLERLAGHDPLTGALNRRGMQRELEAAIEAGRRDVPCALAVLDLDHFKQVNDRHGHQAGDAVLVRFAEVVEAATRRSDRLFRTGGEEFVLLLPGAEADILAHVGSILVRTVAAEVRCGDDPVTVSVGITPLLRGDDAIRWLRRADRAMYRAKRDGRNRVVVDPGEAGTQPPGGDRPR